MVEAVFHLFKIHRKMIFGNPPIIVKNMFSKTPKTFNAINVISGAFVHQVFLVLDRVMLAQTLERIVASELVRKVYRSLSGLFPDNVHQLLGRDTFHYTGINPAIAFQKPENNAFALGSTTTLSFASAAEIALVKLNLAREFAAFQFRHMIDCFSKALIYPCNGLITQSQIMSKLVCWLGLVEALEHRNFSTKLFQRFLFSTALVPAFNISATSFVDFERTAKYALPAPQKVGRTTENILLPCNHMDILSSVGYDYH